MNILRAPLLWNNNSQKAPTGELQLPLRLQIDRLHPHFSFLHSLTWFHNAFFVIREETVLQTPFPINPSFIPLT